jgi:hypothetical protein
MRRKLLLLSLTALVLPAAAGAKTERSTVTSGAAVAVAAPAGLHAFLLRADEPASHVFPRTPSFAWQAVRRPGHYQFELAMSRTFDESQILYKNYKVTTPAIAIPLQLPWMTGKPYALWAHVRFVGRDGSYSRWSTPFGFNTRWNSSDVPKPLDAPLGLVRWTPVVGATAYEVLYPDESPATSFYTTSNVADEREFFTFHQKLGLARIHWRVRAVRYVDEASPLPNSLPRASYGPWSPTYETVNPPSSLVSGPLTPTATVSDVYDRPGQPVRAHELMPGFAWNGSVAVPGMNVGSPLYRVYISTDDHCVNTVFTGAVVGSPAYAPRASGGPLTLPQNTKDLATWMDGRFKLGGSEGTVLDKTGRPIVTNEDPTMPVGGAAGKTADSSAAPTLNGQPIARVDLWDSGWPNGRYYWTVVPVSVTTKALDPDQKPGDSQPIQYNDEAVPQDACETGRTMSFGKISAPVVAQASTPFASGLSPTGRMVAAVKPRPSFHARPLIAWQPAIGAQSYQVQWSKKLYPWKPTGSITTRATAVVLPLSKPGHWYYKVRGINPSLPVGAQNMDWSRPVSIAISGNVFRIATRTK